MKLSEKNKKAMELLTEWAKEPAEEHDEDFYFEMEKSHTIGFFVKIWGRGENIPEWDWKMWVMKGR